MNSLMVGVGWGFEFDLDILALLDVDSSKYNRKMLKTQKLEPVLKNFCSGYNLTNDKSRRGSCITA